MSKPDAFKMSTGSPLSWLGPAEKRVYLAMITVQWGPISICVSAELQQKAAMPSPRGQAVALEVCSAETHNSSKGSASHSVGVTRRPASTELSCWGVHPSQRPLYHQPGDQTFLSLLHQCCQSQLLQDPLSRLPYAIHWEIPANLKQPCQSACNLAHSVMQSSGYLCLSTQAAPNPITRLVKAVAPASST